MFHIKVLTYNIRHGKGTDHLISLKRIARLIKKSDADLVGLQETDKCMPRTHFVFQARYLAYLLGMHYIFGTAASWFLFFKFGNAILSKYPIISYKNTLLPGQGEQRALLQAEVAVKNQKIRFFNTHLGLSDSAREQQVNSIIKILGDIQVPTILVGDFNVLPGDRVIKNLTDTFEYPENTIINDLLTFPSDSPQVKIDYIFLSKHWNHLSEKTLTSKASDHLPILSELKIFSSNTLPLNY